MFRVQGSEPAPELQLIECAPLAAWPGAVRDPFRLTFRGDRNVLLPQSIHRLYNDSMGEVDVFLVPLGPDAHGMNYEAIFN